tara:strand:+ start:225 stop:668 length:444 start_codon:yes stop_codon:yes gene_type:complete
MSKLIEMLRRHEGVESHAYMCSQDFLTIGVGRNIDSGDDEAPRGLGLSEDEINYLLENDIIRVAQELHSEYPWFPGLDEARRDAIVDISFNLGQTRLRGFKKALGAMSEGDWEEASKQFLDSRWAVQVGNRAKELAEMIRTGEYQST